MPAGRRTDQLAREPLRSLLLLVTGVVAMSQLGRVGFAVRRDEVA